MELPEEVVVLRESLRKEARKRGAKLWEQARALRVNDKIPICENCGIRGHSYESHERNASRYEIVGGAIGCKEEFLTYPNSQQVVGTHVLKTPKARHWHKQTFRGKNKGREAFVFVGDR